MILLTTLATFALNLQAPENPYPEPGQGSARYEVPTEDADLKSSAMYDINDIRTRQLQDGTVEINYRLPLELTGAANEIRLQSTNQVTNGTFTNFKGANGEANCDSETCNVRYKNVTVDLAAVKSLLISQGVSGLELDHRLKISALFSGDPAGVIRFNQKALK
jgi:hypothetical protein